MLENHGEVLVAGLGQMPPQLGQQLRQPVRAIAGAVHPERVVESDAVDLEGVDPVDAGVADVLESAAIRVIEVLEEGVLGKVTDVGTVRRFLVQPVVRESAVRRRRIGVVEDAVHQHLDLALVALVDQALEVDELVFTGRGIQRVLVRDREVLNRVVAPAEIVPGRVVWIGPRRPGHEFDGVDPELDELVQLPHDRLERRLVRPTEVRREVVDHQLVDDEILQGQPS